MSDSDTNDKNQILERNVTTLLESGGEAPRLAPAARARIRGALVAKHGVPARTTAAAPVRAQPRRAPWLAIGVGVAALACAALLVTRFTAGGHTSSPDSTVVPTGGTLADGSTWLVEPGAKVAVLGPRHVRVEGAALLDVVPGKGTFVVDTARGRVEVLGTRFYIAADADRTTAAVVRGEVRLTTAVGEVLLHAGEQGVAEAGRPPTRGPAPRLSHLVSWAAEARRTSEDVQPAHHGTLFARDPGVRSHPPWGEEYPLPLKQLTVDITVEDQVARVALDQTFHNNEQQALEGVYRFAIPPDASLQRLAMYVDGKLTESAVVERMQGRRIYEELVYRRVDPALLEWAGNGRLSLRVYPLPAREDKRIVLAYTQSLPKLYDDWTLTVPLPEIDQPIGDLKFAVRVKGCANCELTSTSHAITVDRKGDDAFVTYERANAQAGDSLVLHVRDSRHQTTVASHTDGQDQFLLVRAPAEVAKGAAPYRPRSWVLLDDVSASRDAAARHAQADLVDAFLRELDEHDTVSVVAFDVSARTKLLPTRVLDVDRRAVRTALSTEGGVGATDFSAGLAEAAKLLAGTPADDAMVVYFGDGVVTSGTRHLDELRAQLARTAHFIGVGVGDAPDTQTLEALAGATGGYSTTIDLADDLGWRAFDLVAALHTARVTNVDARLVDAQGASIPATLYLRSPQLADGEEVELVAKLAGAGTPAAIELTGTASGAPWQQRIALRTTTAAAIDAPAAPAADAGYLPRLWAQRHIAARLLAKHEAVPVPPCGSAAAGRYVKCPSEAELREARDEGIRKEVVALGKKYFLLSRHTSLLVLENDAMYAQFHVAKGTGETWAPYVVPATIPVVKSKATAAVAVQAAISTDAELLRPPLVVYYDYAPQLRSRWAGDALGEDNGERNKFSDLSSPVGGATGTGVTTVVLPQGNTAAGPAIATGAPAQTQPFSSNVAADPTSATEAPATDTAAVAATKAIDMPDEAKAGKNADRDLHLAQDEGILGGLDEYKEGGFGFGRRGIAAGQLGLGRMNEFQQPMYFEKGGEWAGTWGSGPQLYLQRLAQPADPAYDDLTALVPALVEDSADLWRARIGAVRADHQSDRGGPHQIDDAARALLADARRALPSGIYRWDGAEIALDDARRFGWRRTTDTDLAETASFDGATFLRRYAELGVDAERKIGDDDVALALAYLPIWIAEPAHYARWFAVRADGQRVLLQHAVRGKVVTAFALAFDSAHHLVSIADGRGTELVRVTWGVDGPTSARVLGHDVAVSFARASIADAPAWAHRGARAGVLVQQPLHIPLSSTGAMSLEAPGSAEWRNDARQAIAAYGALGQLGEIPALFANLAAHGGVEPGDVVLASGGLANQNDAQFAASLAAMGPLRDAPAARYLAANRAYRNSGVGTAHVAPDATTGHLGALWTLRDITSYTVVGKTKPATDRLLALGERAPALRMIAATSIGTRYDAPKEDVVRAWDSVASGPQRNTVRAMAVQALYARGAYDLAADRIAALVEDLDLRAAPPDLSTAQYIFQASRRGAAGWELVWAAWRERVLAGASYEHAMALLASAATHPTDVPAIAQHAVELAAGDPARTVEVAQLAARMGSGPLARSILAPVLKAHPTHDLYQLAGTLALQTGQPSEALADFAAAQDAAGEAAPLAVVRAELTQLLAAAQQVAVQSVGPVRDDAVKQALAFGARWRQIDPGNPQIDVRLGELLLAVGDKAEAWRQLSTVIERDPMSGQGYALVADAFERQGRVADALDYWQQSIVIDQTNPTPRLRKAQALIAVGRVSEGDALLSEIANRPWHDMWSGVVYQAKELLARGKQR